MLINHLLFRLSFAFVVISAMAGCEPPDSTTTPNVAGSEATSNTTGSEPVTESEVTNSSNSDAADTVPSLSVELVDFAGFQDHVKKLSGKVVVVDVWSTSCPPCMREYPNLVTLSKRWPNQVACLSLNVDYIGIKSKPADSYLPKVSEFLIKQQSQSVTNLMSTEADSDVFEKLKIDSIPVVFIYDREGKLLKTFSEGNSGEDGLTYAGDVIPAIEAMIKE